jgi:hypothetical protein
MQKRTIQYVAGLMDAEGCFNIARSFRRSSNCYNYIAQIIFTNTNLALMKWVVTYFGGVYKKRKLISGHKQAYDWKITNQTHALSFLSAIAPYLIVKSQEADLMIQYYALNGRECPEIRDTLFKRIKALKWNKGSVTTDSQEISNAYVAGFIDGDGGVSLTQTLYADNAHKGLISALHKKYGGNFSCNQLSKKHSNWNDSYRWSLSNREKSEKILLSWIPYLIDKRKRALNALNMIRQKSRYSLNS